MTAIELNDLPTEIRRRIEQEAGAEMIQVCRDGEPFGLIQFVGPLPATSGELRPIGLAAGTFTVPPSFFEPLPDDLLSLFQGEGP